MSVMPGLSIVRISAAILIIGLFSVCAKQEKKELASAEVSVTDDESGLHDVSEVYDISGTYWKAVTFSIDGIDEFWADLFLWEDGEAYFRFSQATLESNYYGFRDVFDCSWVLDNGTLILTKTSALPAETYTGTLVQDLLQISYDGLPDETFTITMEKSEMPPYGVHWELPDIYGTWRMVSYSDQIVDYTVNELGWHFNSEIAIYPTGQAEFLLDDQFNYVEMECELYVVQKDGPIWEGCKNQAWHVELTGSWDPDIKYFAAVSDDKLLFRKAYKNHPDGYPLSFTAVYEYIGMYIPLSEPTGFFSPKADDE